jgi:ABC-type lipoprotein export system ATPase subunit
VLEFKDLTKEYCGSHGPIQALAGVSLTVERGEVVVLQGPSGCGKTTLLLIAGGLLQADSGSVRVCGQALAELPAEALARFRASHIGFVFQQFHLVPYLSVLDNILAPTLAQSLPNAEERARHLMARFGLDRRAGHVPAALSTGERQRTALARALLTQPKLLLADEPTGNLDPENGQRVLEGLRAYAAEGGAVLLVTHDAALAQHFPRMVLMREGRLGGVAQC